MKRFCALLVLFILVFGQVMMVSADATSSADTDPSSVLISLNQAKDTGSSIEDTIKASTSSGALNLKSTIGDTSIASNVDNFKKYLQTKIMTQDDLNAFDWSFIISQFTMPFSGNLTNTLNNQEIFQEMTTQNTQISSNPFAGFGSSSYADPQFSNKPVISKVEFAKISNTIRNNMKYMPIFDCNGKTVTVSDFYGISDWNTMPSSTGGAYYFQDSVYYYGNEAPSDDYPVGQSEKFLQNQEPYMFNTDSLSNLNNASDAKNIHVVHTKNWIYQSSNITNFYAQLFLANYLKYENATDTSFAKSLTSKSTNMAMSFLQSIGSDQVEVDSFGDLVYYTPSGYVMLYPNYANPIFSADVTNGSATLSGYSTSKYSGTSNTDSGFNYAQRVKSVLSIKPDEDNGLHKIPDPVNWMSSLPIQSSDTQSIWQASDEKMMMYNKAIDTVYSQNIQPCTQSSVQELNSTSGNEYLGPFIVNSSESASYTNSLIIAATPVMSYCNTNAAGVSHNSTTTSVPSWDPTSKSLTWRQENQSGQLVAPSNSLSNKILADIKVWINNRPNPIALFASYLTGNATHSTNWYDSLLKDSQWDVYSWFNGSNSLTASNATATTNGGITVPNIEIQKLYSQQNYVSAFYSANKDYVIWNMDYSDLENDNGSNQNTYAVDFLPESSLDFAQGWNIFSDKDKGMFIPRNYQYITDGSDSNKGKVNPKYRFDTVYYELRDNRVSDLWLNYSNDDVPIIAFTWLNYYENEFTFNKLLSGKLLEYQGVNGAHPVYYKFQYTYNGKTVPTSTNVIDSSAVFLPFEPECDSGLEEADTGNSSTIMYNPYALVMGLYRNTNFESVTTVAAGTSNVTANPQTVLDMFYAILQNPVTAIGNIISGFFQTVHNAIATGTSYSVFNFDWLFSAGILKWLFSHYYLIIAPIIILIVLRFILDIFLHKSKLSTQLLKSVVCIVLSLVPEIATLGVITLSDNMTQSLLKATSNRVALVETEMRTQDAINADAGFEEQYQVFRQQFSNVSSGYSDIRLNLLNNYDTQMKSGTYKLVNLSDLLDNVSYVKLAATTDGASTNQLRIWYDKNGFVPVHYQLYSQSLFYYFYDWIKYQYLHYYSDPTEASLASGLTASDLEGFTNYASQYTGMGTEQSAPSTSTDGKGGAIVDPFVEKVFTLEKQGLVTLKGGIPLMYDDMNYVYGKSLSDGFGMSYQDMFGLGYLFKSNSAADTLLSQISKSNVKMPEDTDAIHALQSAYLPLGALMNSTYFLAYSGLDRQQEKYGGGYAYPFSSGYVKDYTTPNPGTLFGGVNSGSSANPKQVRNKLDASLDDIYTVSGGTRNAIQTPLEYRLSQLTGKMYNDIEGVMSYHSSEISDDTQMKMAALICTFDFNNEFGKSSILDTPVQPTGFTNNSVDLDKVNRIMFAGSIKDIENDNQLMYMLWDKSFGLILCIMVLMFEALMVLSSILRCILIVIVFVLSVVLCVWYYLLKKNTSQRIWMGLIFDVLAILGCQWLILGEISLITRWEVSGSTGMDFLYALLLLLGISIVVFIEISVVIALFKDWRNLGAVAITNQFNNSMRNLKSGFGSGGPMGTLGFGGYPRVLNSMRVHQLDLGEPNNELPPTAGALQQASNNVGKLDEVELPVTDTSVSPVSPVVLEPPVIPLSVSTGSMGSDEIANLSESIKGVADSIKASKATERLASGQQSENRFGSTLNNLLGGPSSIDLNEDVLDSPLKTDNVKPIHIKKTVTQEPKPPQKNI